MVEVLLQLGLASALVTFVHLLVPRLALGGVLFGVTVPEGFRQGPAGAAIVRRYRLQVLGVGLLGLGALGAAAAAGQEALAGVAVAAVAVLSTGAWISARARTRPHGTAPTAVRRAGLSAPRGVPPVLDALPFLVLAAAAVWLALRWDALPERFAVHWDGRGVANRWAERTPGDVFGPLASGALLCLGLMGLRAAIVAFSPLRGSDPRGVALRRFTAFTITAAATFVAVLNAAVALSPLLVEGPWLVVGLAGGGVALLLPALAIASTRLAALPSPGPGDGTPDERWRLGGLFYVNPDDPAVFVPKRAGLGYTVNLGRPGGVVALAAVLGVPALIALLTHLLGR